MHRYLALLYSFWGMAPNPWLSRLQTDSHPVELRGDRIDLTGAGIRIERFSLKGFRYVFQGWQELWNVSLSELRTKITPYHSDMGAHLEYHGKKPQ